MIDSGQISVVIQGPINERNREAVATNVRKVREVLPESEIIVSTWRGAGARDLDLAADDVLELEDPGAVVLGADTNCNVDRQIYSVFSGLQRASRRYALRMRVDTSLANTGFLLSYQNMLEDRELPRTTLFEQRVLATSLYFRDPSKIDYLFHPSDIFHFGLRGDLLKLWGVPLVRWKHSFAVRLALVPEQYIWISCLLLNGYLPFRLDSTRFSLESILLSDWSLATNWWVIDGKSRGVLLPERFETASAPEKVFLEPDWRSFAIGAGKKPRLFNCRWSVLRKLGRRVV
jgi:hypothetical protein